MIDAFGNEVGDDLVPARLRVLTDYAKWKAKKENYEPTNPKDDHLYNTEGTWFTTDRIRPRLLGITQAEDKELISGDAARTAEVVRRIKANRDVELAK